MSFNIKIQTTSSVNNKISKNISDIVTLTGTLKNDTSVIDPVILIDAGVDVDENFFLANYATIPKFGRSYFITDIRSVRNGLIEISMHVDVLETYKDEIKNLDCIVRRTADKDYINLYLDDGTFSVYQNPDIDTKLFPSGFTAQSIILAVAGS